MLVVADIHSSNIEMGIIYTYRTSGSHSMEAILKNSQKSRMSHQLSTGGEIYQETASLVDNVKT